MANTPNTVTITVTNAEVAAELEALALAYEETVQKLRYEADRLRQGFQLTLNVSATQVILPTPDYQELEHDDPRHADEQDPLIDEEAEAYGLDDEKLQARQVRAENLIDPRRSRMVFNQVADQQRPRVSHRLAPKGTRIKPEDITGGLTQPLPEDAIRLIDSMTTTTEEEE